MPLVTKIFSRTTLNINDTGSPALVCVKHIVRTSTIRMCLYYKIVLGS
jgi:hypothetical protein